VQANERRGQKGRAERATGAERSAGRAALATKLPAPIALSSTPSGIPAGCEIKSNHRERPKRSRAADVGGASRPRAWIRLIKTRLTTNAGRIPSEGGCPIPGRGSAMRPVQARDGASSLLQRKVGSRSLCKGGMFLSS
jgi:hypothetical protein